MLLYFNKNDYFCLGTFTKAHGIKGELLLKAEFELPDDIEETELIFIEIDEQLVPFFIADEGITVKNDFEMILKIKDIDSVKKTNELVGLQVYLPLNKDQDEDYISKYHDLTGFDVIDTIYGKIGKLEEIIRHQANPLLKIKKGLIEILIPLQEEFIKKIDLENKIIELKSPEGLIDFYLNGEDIH